MQGREKFLAINIVSATSSILFQLLPLSIAWSMGPNLGRILLAAVTARLIAIGILSVFCVRELTAGQKMGVERAETIRLLRYGGWVTVASLCSPLLVIVDRFAIGAVLGAVDVAAYTIPYQPAKQIQVLPNALVTALFPRLSASSTDTQKSMLTSSVRTVLALVSLPVLGGILLSEPALRAWVGPSLGLRAAPIAKILLLGFWINAVCDDTLHGFTSKWSA